MKTIEIFISNHWEFLMEAANEVAAKRCIEECIATWEKDNNVSFPYKTRIV